MPPPTALGQILVARRFACPTYWWASCSTFGVDAELHVSVSKIVPIVRGLHLNQQRLRLKHIVFHLVPQFVEL